MEIYRCALIIGNLTIRRLKKMRMPFHELRRYWTVSQEIRIYSSRWWLSSNRVRGEPQKIIAFTVGHLGFCESNRMPFGLSNSPASKQRLMEDCIGQLNFNICFIVLDNFIIFFFNNLYRTPRSLTASVRLIEASRDKTSSQKMHFLLEKYKICRTDSIQTGYWNWSR